MKENGIENEEANEKKMREFVTTAPFLGMLTNKQ